MESIIEKIHLIDSVEELNKKSELLTIYTSKYEDGSSIIKSFHVFPGVELIFNNFFSFDAHEGGEKMENIIEINYCKKGRYESIFNDNEYGYLGEGDIAYSLIKNENRVATFSMGYYEGCSILIDSNIADGYLKDSYADMNINILNIKKKLFSENWYSINHAAPEIRNIFEGIYDVKGSNKIYFYKLKILEILLILKDVNNRQLDNKYYTEAQIDKISDIKRYISKNYNMKITLKYLSEVYNVSTSFLQNGFKDLYGKTIAEYIREYRICQAAKMIKETNDNIMNISLCVGYDNASKFAVAFKKIMGKTPREYRLS